MGRVKYKQSGVALITVMLILALATVTAVSMASRQNIDIHRSANILNYEQAFQYILGAEDFSQIMLARHFKDKPLIVTETDVDKWKVTFPVEGGSISGQVEDLHALFNINSLVDSKGNPNLSQVARFTNLLAELNINTNIVDPIVDWLDRYENPFRTNGVEDNEYLGYEVPYRTANQPMSDISELLLIKGIDKDVYDILLPHVCVLKNIDTKINVNTASAEVISSLHNSITLAQAQTLVDNRNADGKGFSSVDDFLSDPIFAGLKIKKEDLSLTSNFFRLTSLAIIEKTNLRFVSQLYRDEDGVINVIKRSRSVL